MPNLTVLEVVLDLHDEDESHVNGARHLLIPGIDWSTCLPAGLESLVLPKTILHGKLLQDIARHPSLTYLMAFGIVNHFVDPIDLNGSSLKHLRLAAIPSFEVIARFEPWSFDTKISTWMRAFTMSPIMWNLNFPSSLEQTLTIEKAATRLSQNMESAKLMMIRLLSDNLAEDFDFGSCLSVIRALAPLRHTLFGLSLENWRITASVLGLCMETLPNICFLQIHGGSVISSCAWDVLASWTNIQIFALESPATQGFSSSDIMSFAARSRSKMKLNIFVNRQHHLCSVDDPIVLDRSSLGLPPVQIMGMDLIK